MSLRLLLFLASLTAVTPGMAQSDSTLSFDEEANVQKTLITNAFNSSYIINGHSTNTLSRGRLNFFIAHRFGTFNQGAFNLFGLDYASIRYGFEYGVTNHFTAGIGRSSTGKNYDGFLKYKLLTQSYGGGASTPVSLVWFSSAAISSVEYKARALGDPKANFTDYLVYTHQALISRQFSPKLSLQLSPTLVHRNRVLSQQKNDIYALGIGGRLKLSKKVHLMADYYHVFNPASPGVFDPIAVGVDMVVGGHVFQLYLNNANGLIEKEFLTNTRSDATKGEIRFGFTVMRSFVLKPEIKGGSIH